jgi:hypothetical protein
MYAITGACTTTDCATRLRWISYGRLGFPNKTIEAFVESTSAA